MVCLVIHVGGRHKSIFRWLKFRFPSIPIDEYPGDWVLSSAIQYSECR